MRILKRFRFFFQRIIFLFVQRRQRKWRKYAVGVFREKHHLCPKAQQIKAV